MSDTQERAAHLSDQAANIPQKRRISWHISAPLLDRLELHAKTTGQTVTEAFEKLISDGVPDYEIVAKERSDAA